MNRHTIRYALILVAALAVAALAVARFDGLCSIFSTVWSAFEPLAIGAVLAYLLNFIAAALESRWFPHTNNALAIKTRRPICVILAITAVTLALAALTSFVGGEFESVGAAIITGISEAAAMASQAIANLPGAQAVPILDNATWNSIGQKALDAMGGTDQALRIVAQTSGEVAHLTLSILLGMVFALYLLLDKDRVHAGAMRAASFIPGEDLRRRVLHACSITNDCFSRFIRGQCIEAVILGALCAIGGTILQFPYAASIGLIVGVSSLIPFAGAWIGGVMGAAMILSQDPVRARAVHRVSGDPPADRGTPHLPERGGTVGGPAEHLGVRGRDRRRFAVRPSRRASGCARHLHDQDACHGALRETGRGKSIGA